MSGRQTLTLVTSTCLIAASAAIAGDGDWVNYENSTSDRMPTGGDLNDPSTSTNDDREKDYAWGDVDLDGDIDLVCVRKQPFTSAGRNTNVLFMNEGKAEGHAMNGVLVDRTEEYATASDVDGDNGFLTPTNDRDVILADVDADGWLDMITVVTLTDNAAKHLSHPRVYMNLGEVAGEWQGFEYQDARIPQLHPNAGPRFCSLAVGDIDGDKDLDLWFGDYDSGPSQIFDFNNRLMINDGNGFFTDVSTDRMTNQMRDTNFGAASIIADINGDGVNDCIKQTSLSAPTEVGIIYNDPNNEGFFNLYQSAYSLAAYFISVDDLNGDGRLDMVVVDDGTDRYLLNQGNDSQGRVNFTQFTFPNSGGFGGNSWIADFNNDGHKDVIITDVDVDISGCSRTTLIYRNLGDVPDITMAQQGQPIPNSELRGVHDVAVFDINGDGWLDMVLGKCDGTQIWMNQPPTGLVFSYPMGLPGLVDPGEETTFQIKLDSIGGVDPEDGSAELFVSIDDAPFAEIPLTNLGGDLYEGALPAMDCTVQAEFYIQGELENGERFSDPPTAPGTAYGATATFGIVLSLRDEIEGDVSEWSISSSNLTSGEWEQAEPNGTVHLGDLMAPPNDATQSADAVMAFVTENGPAGGSASANDLDGGPTYLTSPTIDLLGTDATISYSRWFRSAGGTPDALHVEVSNDGGKNWWAVGEETTLGTDSAWETSSFVIGDYVEPSADVRVRFVASDFPNDSVTEAGIDNFQVEEFDCGSPCPADISGNDGVIDVNDLLTLLGGWGTDGPGAEIAAPEGVIDVNDLLALLGAWGDCL